MLCFFLTGRPRSGASGILSRGASLSILAACLVLLRGDPTIFCQPVTAAAPVGGAGRAGRRERLALGMVSGLAIAWQCHELKVVVVFWWR
jgi:hypothetical protein